MVSIIKSRYMLKVPFFYIEGSAVLPGFVLALDYQYLPDHPATWGIEYVEGGFEAEAAGGGVGFGEVSDVHDLNPSGCSRGVSWCLVIKNLGYAGYGVNRKSA
jgi:hypothetical protein|tara:strand:+ start:51 stop:359 length:309 start_codon:yes stop_codon:yes gene_type:complete